MSYLNKYLKIIPKADADIIRRNIAENKELFEIKNLSEENYKELVNNLIEKDELFTKEISLESKITAKDLNDFYSNVSFDLHKIFPTQNNIERLGENYERIYEGHLEELANEIEKIKYSVDRLSSQEEKLEDTKRIEYSFEPDLKSEYSETYSEDTSFLYIDRDGQEKPPANQEKLFHTYQLTLAKTKDINLLLNDSGITTAKIEVVYQSPNTIANTNPQYDISKAIDGDPSTFWINKAKKPNNSIDFINILPGRVKEGRKYVRDTE